VNSAHESVLCVKLASRGDLLLAAPAFQRLRRTRPEAHLSLLVGRSCHDVASRLPYFDDIRVVDDAALFGSTSIARIRAGLAILRTMWKGPRNGSGESACGAFSEVIILHRDWRYSPLAWLAGIPVRRGFASARASRLLTHAYRAGEDEHHLDQYLGVAGFAGGGSTSLTGLFRFLPGEREEALAQATHLGFGGATRWVAFGFGGGKNVKTRTELKQWPLEHFQSLAELLSVNGFGVVWLGDEEDAAALGSPPVGVNLAGRLTVPASAAVLSACAAAVANDTMLLHLGAAVGTPMVGLFGPTDPAHYRPRNPDSTYRWLGHEAVPCSPCHREGFYPRCTFDHRCMKGLDVQSVLAAVLACARGAAVRAGES
jgi:ADP-heptose:LPS heptosyltransferase